MEREILQDIVLDHFRDPRLKAQLSETEEGVSTIRNPNCGDIVMLKITRNAGDALEWVQNAQGCAASVASASILCEHLNHLNRADAVSVVHRFLQVLESEEIEGNNEISADIELQALLYFRSVPARKLCVSLAWTAAKNALAALCDGE